MDTHVSPETATTEPAIPVQSENHSSEIPSTLSPMPPSNTLHPIKKIFMVIIVFIVVLGIGGVSYLLGIKNSSLYQQKPIPTQKVLPTPTPTPDPTADWQTYTSQKYLYSVKYPKTLKINEQNTYYYYVEFDPIATHMLPTYVVSVIADTFSVKNVEAYNFMSSDWINTLYSLKVGGVATSSTGATFTRLADTVVAGQQALVIEVKAVGFMQHRVYLKQNGNIYMLSNYYQDPSELNNFTLFMNSFKFTSVSTINGQTYADSSQKFSFAYPTGWQVVDNSSSALSLIVVPDTLAPALQSDIAANHDGTCHPYYPITIRDDNPEETLTDTDYQKVTQSPITVAGIAGTKYSFSMNFKPCDWMTGKYEEAQFHYQGKKYTISLIPSDNPTYQKAYQQVLNSFTFTQ